MSHWYKYESVQKAYLAVLPCKNKEIHIENISTVLKLTLAPCQSRWPRDIGKNQIERELKSAWFVYQSPTGSMRKFTYSRFCFHTLWTDSNGSKFQSFQRSPWNLFHLIDESGARGYLEIFFILYSWKGFSGEYFLNTLQYFIAKFVKKIRNPTFARSVETVRS